MQGHDQNFVDEELEKVDKLLRHDLLQEKDQEQQDPKPIQLILTYNQFLPNLTAAIHKKLEHPLNQQKSLGLISRTPDYSL